MSSDTLLVVLTPDGKKVDQMDARGRVEFQDSDRTGHGDRLLVMVDEYTMIPTGIGREAIVQDMTGQQVVRGSSLTMERSGGRIMVESEHGGRTWINLKPRQKGAPGSGSDPQN